MIDKSTSAALDRIFDEMYNLISAASRIPLTDKIIVEESDLAEILDDLKEAIKGADMVFVTCGMGLSLIHI